MISINNRKVDLALQVQEYTSTQKVLDSLTLDTHDILVICPPIFLQRFMLAVFDSVEDNLLEAIDNQLERSNGFISFGIGYKNKHFNFSFIILSGELKTISHPFNGKEEVNVGFKQIRIT